MGAKRNDIQPGDVFGRWSVIEYSGQDQNGKRLWRVMCQGCGASSVVRASKLATGRTRACRRCCHVRHGLSWEHAYQIAIGVQKRTTDPSCPGYRRYGGRGITLYPDWHGQEGLERMARWIMANLPPWQRGLSLDRIDNERGYEPGNLRWATAVEQANNRRSNRPITWRGRTQNLKQWARELGIPRDTLAWRLDHGWSIDRAMTTPVRPIRRAAPNPTEEAA